MQKRLHQFRGWARSRPSGFCLLVFQRTPFAIHTRRLALHFIACCNNMSTSNSYGATSTSGSGLKANLSRRPGGAGSESGVQRTNSEQQKPPAVSKVEPKVFLASERTFFSWIRVSLLLGSFGLALFNSGDGLGRAMGLTYAGISLLAVRPSCRGAAVDGIGLI